MNKTNDSYEGPTAEEILPSQRINEGFLYQEDLVAMFGDQAALRGVALEIVDAVPSSLKSDPSGKKTKATVALTFKSPDGSGAMPKRLGINKTIKKALISRFDSAVLARWVGWVTLYVDPAVEDRRTGELVRAIRVKSVAPKMAPTFDYAANIKKRIERALKARGSAKTPKDPVVELTPEQISATEDEAAAAADLADLVKAQMERSFTEDPEDGGEA